MLRLTCSKSNWLLFKNKLINEYFLAVYSKFIETVKDSIITISEGIKFKI
jgi:hypothetical protein